jgi:hypothetical protein
LRASIPSSPYGPSPAFLTPSTACSSSSLAGLFHPAATSGIHLSGVSSRCPALTPRRRPVPSCRWRASPTVGLPRRHQLPPLRLQGFDPSSDPKSPAEGLALPTPRSPPRFSLPRAPLRIPGRRRRAASAHDLGHQTLRVNLATGLQRINRYPTQYSVSRLLSRSSFPACLAHLPPGCPGGSSSCRSGFKVFIRAAIRSHRQRV